MDGRGWAVQPGGFDPSAERPADAGHSLETGLRELSRRLDELMASVETLGAEGRWPQPARSTLPATSIPAPEHPVANWEQYEYEPPPPPPPAPVYGGWANPYAFEEPSWRTWEPEPGYLPAPIEPAAWEQPFEAPAPDWLPAGPPAMPPEVRLVAPAAPLIEIANLDAGPFADLIELRHFEDALSELARVRDVRVRRFGHHRASIEVAVSSAPLLEDELQLLGREMSIGATPEGEVVVEIVAEDVVGETAAEDAPAEGEGR